MAKRYIYFCIKSYSGQSCACLVTQKCVHVREQHQERQQCWNQKYYSSSIFYVHKKKNKIRLQAIMTMSYDANVLGSWLSQCLCYWRRVLLSEPNLETLQL